MVADYQGSQFEGRVSSSIKLAAQPRELQFVTPTHKEGPAGDLRRPSIALFFAAISRRNRLVFDPQLLPLFLAAPWQSGGLEAKVEGVDGTFYLAF